MTSPIASSPRIVFMGTPDFAVSSLDAIHQAGLNVVGVVTVPDRQTGRGLKITYSPVKEYALSHQLPLLQPEKLRAPEFLESLQALQADLFVVVAFRMLPREVWSMPRLGTFNLHASLLPQYRGAAPINWAVINGEHETGVTTFLLNERIDEGQILLQERIPIHPSDTAETIHDTLASLGKDVVLRTIKGLSEGTLHGAPQILTHPDGTPIQLRPAPKIFKPDCSIPWHLSGSQIVNFVRGLSPYPAAVMQMTDSKGTVHSIKVFDASFEPDEKTTDNAFLTDGKTFLKIRIADGFIRINTLQINGKKKNSIEEFLRGHNLTDWKLIQ